jgi:hypothetical protein
MIRKSGYRFSEKIMLKQEAKAKWRFNLNSVRFSAWTRPVKEIQVKPLWPGEGQPSLWTVIQDWR